MLLLLRFAGFAVWWFGVRGCLGDRVHIETKQEGRGPHLPPPAVLQYDYSYKQYSKHGLVIEVFVVSKGHHHHPSSACVFISLPFHRFGLVLQYV